MGWQELLVILVIVLLIFGAKRVPEIFRSLGAGVGEFKKGLREGAEEPVEAPKPKAEATDSAKPQTPGE